MTIRTVELVRFGHGYDAVTTSGVRARFGDPAEGGLSPMDTVLAALGGCTAMDVASIATKKRQRIERYAVRVQGIQRDEHPRVFSRIDVIHEVEGEGLDAEAIRTRENLSPTTYDSARRRLRRALLKEGLTHVPES
jgi:putative redox protein